MDYESDFRHNYMGQVVPGSNSKFLLNVNPNLTYYPNTKWKEINLYFNRIVQKYSTVLSLTSIWSFFHKNGPFYTQYTSPHEHTYTPYTSTHEHIYTSTREHIYTFP